MEGRAVAVATVGGTVVAAVELAEDVKDGAVVAYPKVGGAKAFIAFGQVVVGVDNPLRSFLYLFRRIVAMGRIDPGVLRRKGLHRGKGDSHKGDSKQFGVELFHVGII